MSEVTILAPEALSGVRKAQEALRQQADKLTAIGDPSGPAVAGLAAAMEATCRLVVDATLTQQKLAEEGRKPWTRDEMRLLVTQMRDTLMHLWTGFNRVAIVISVAGAVLFGGLCAVGGYLYHGAAPVIAGVSAGAQQCQDQQGGGRICWIPVWERLPPAR